MDKRVKLKLTRLAARLADHIESIAVDESEAAMDEQVKRHLTRAKSLIDDAINRHCWTPDAVNDLSRVLNVVSNDLHRLAIEQHEINREAYERRDYCTACGGKCKVIHG